MERVKKYEHRIGLLLRLGVITSSILMAIGLLLAAFQQPQSSGVENPTLKELLAGLFAGEIVILPASLFMFGGLVVLLLTPFLRVLAALFAFLAEKDWRFVGVAALVFCILVGQLIYTLQ
ncbi:MAG: DUF1634 domain-containing protein [Ignavibacteriae bacterium]|nr:DUF1634 domain-containing protein [Ignavibacteriota bacterium]